MEDRVIDSRESCRRVIIIFFPLYWLKCEINIYRYACIKEEG